MSYPCVSSVFAPGYDRVHTPFVCASSTCVILSYHGVCLCACVRYIVGDPDPSTFLQPQLDVPTDTRSLCSWAEVTDGARLGSLTARGSVEATTPSGLAVPVRCSRLLPPVRWRTHESADHKSSPGTVT